MDVFSRNVLCPLMVSTMWPCLQARGWMEHRTWKVVDSCNERHSFTLVETGIPTGNSRDIFNTTCDALSSWSLDPMLSGAVWFKINLEKLVCTLVSWPMFQVTVALPSGYSEKFSIAQSSTVGDLRRLALFMYLFMLFLKIFLMYLYILAQVHKAFLCCSFLFSSQQTDNSASHMFTVAFLWLFSFDVSNDFHFSCPGGQVGSLLCFISLFYFIHRAIPERRAMNHRDKFK